MLVLYLCLANLKVFTMQFGPRVLGRSPEFWLHSGKSAIIGESNHGSGVICKEHYAYYYVPKSSILLAGTGVWKISSGACEFSSIKIDYSDYQQNKGSLCFFQ